MAAGGAGSVWSGVFGAEDVDMMWPGSGHLILELLLLLAVLYLLLQKSSKRTPGKRGGKDAPLTEEEVGGGK